MKKIVFTGPESVGKSTLTRQVANYYSFPSVQEIARQYFEKRSTNYCASNGAGGLSRLVKKADC